MTRKFLYLISILIVLAPAACGPAPEPTLSADDIRNTAVAQAWMAMTMTRLAIPTATLTPIPPSPTPQPTFTPFPIQPVVVDTSVPLAQPTEVCNQVPPIKPKGDLVTVRFVNKSAGSVNLSFGMNQPNSKGECVTYTFTLGAYDSPEVSVLAGCYWAYGWVQGKTPSTAQTIDPLCIISPGTKRDVWISKEVISFH